MQKPFELGFISEAPEIEIDQLPITGRLPEWLTGTLLRNGPGAFQVGNSRYRHWFDGLAMLHRFTIADGRISYANKFLESNSYLAAKETGRITYSEFATDPCRSMFGRVMAVFSPQITDSAKVSIDTIAGRFMALAETPIQVEFDPQTLRKVGVFQYEEDTTGQMTTVHPHHDPHNGDVYNVVTRYHMISHYNIYRLNGDGGQARVASLPVHRPAYMHSFGMTENYIIMAEFPLVVNPVHLLLWLKPYIENFKWQPERGTLFWVVNRHTGELVGRYQADPFFAFHHVNAFERGNEVVVDIDAYDDARILDAWYLDTMEQGEQPLPFGQLRRYTIPLQGGRAEYETIAPDCLELPRFDYDRYNTRGDYRSVYGVSMRPDGPRWFYDQLVKIDVQSGHAQTWTESETYPGEPVFVGRPGREAEDDGVLLSVVLDAAKGSSFLLVLDAATLTEVARAELPHPVLFGYHGAYLNNEELRIKNE
jgi:beta,beta-carotene 9',10'-dioxygenase